MNTELKEAIEALEKEKNIMRETLFEAIENALLTACKSNFGRVDNIKAWVDRDTFEYYCTAEKEVVESKDDVEDKLTQIALEDAVKINPAVRTGDKVEVKINSQSFGRIATQIAKNVILQKIREEERSAIYDYYIKMQKNIVTGIVQRINGGNISVNLGRAEGLLNEKETVPSEHLKPTDRIKVYIIDVRTTNRGPRILVSRTHPELVKKLFEQEVAEIQDKVVEIKSIAREAGSRTKIAVYSNDPRVDAVGACVGVNGIRVNNIVEELRGEKIDIFYANAGFPYYEKFDYEDWARVKAIFDANTLSPIYTYAKYIRHLDGRPGILAYTVSAIGEMAMPGYAIYSSSKFALNGFQQAILSGEYGL